jgi:hypothetical protein
MRSFIRYLVASRRYRRAPHPAEPLPMPRELNRPDPQYCPHCGQVGRVNWIPTGNVGSRGEEEFIAGSVECVNPDCPGKHRA